MVPPPHLLKKFSEQARVDSKKRGHSGYCKTFAALCIDWALSSQPMTDLSPAAQAVFSALNSEFDWIEDGVPGPQFKSIAAALCAAAAHLGSCNPSDELLAIATELENHK